MSTSTALSIVGLSDKTEITLAPDFIKHRDEVLTLAKEVRVVFDEDSQKTALAVLDQLKDMRIGVEKTREAVKAPVIALGKKIEATAKEAVERVESEEKRIKFAVEKHQMELRQKAAAQERLREAEAAEAKRQDEARQAEIVKRQQEADEAARKAAEAANPAARKKAAEAAAKAQEQADRLALEAEDAELERQDREREQSQLSVMSSGEIKGREKWDFEVVEIMAFARNFPDLCKMEAKRREILEAIESGQFDTPINPDTEKLLTAECQLNEKTIRVAQGLRIFKTVKI